MSDESKMSESSLSSDNVKSADVFADSVEVFADIPDDDSSSQEEKTPIMTAAEMAQHNLNLIETNVRFVGSKSIIGQVVQLIAYIRNGIKNNREMDINVHLGNTVANPDFMFDVNGLAVPDLVAVSATQVN